MSHTAELIKKDSGGLQLRCLGLRRPSFASSLRPWPQGAASPLAQRGHKGQPISYGDMLMQGTICEKLSLRPPCAHFAALREDVFLNRGTKARCHREGWG